MKRRVISIPKVTTLGHFIFARQRVKSHGEVLTIGTAQSPSKSILKRVCQKASKFLFVKNDSPPIISPQIPIAKDILIALLNNPNTENSANTAPAKANANIFLLNSIPKISVIIDTENDTSG